MPFEAFLNQKQGKPGLRRQLTVSLSLAAHGALAIAAVVHSFWHTDELSPPTVTVTFLAAAPPPPPPPPPPKKRTQTQTKTITREIVQPKPNEIVQPKTKEEEQKDEGEENGEEGGEVGGVAGGVVGGVVGAAPPPPPPPPKEEAPRFLPPSVAGQNLLTNPMTDPRYRVVLPPALAKAAGMQLWAMLKVCVSKAGDVSDVKIIKGMDPTVDPLLQAKVQTWKYKPVTIDGRPVNFCYNLRYNHTTAQ